MCSSTRSGATSFPEGLDPRMHSSNSIPRPGVMERLGLGPDVFLREDGGPGLNERLIYARIAGYVLVRFFRASTHDITDSLQQV